ncbi:hypothetical protein [Rhizobium leguminosarum]|uniref:hypothetical protein n=1 Tax=Rhizobium leguminosarum TaxID=384 RepID=UPI001F19CC09|nr:hypothetical protein [Rhizobium leguminosarum]UIJ82970.1 hypothetical protein LZK78_27255 [Rhizobium leguminosarum]
MIQVYRYKAYNSCFCAAPSEAIIATFGSIDQFETFFGGGAKFGVTAVLLPHCSLSPDL